MFNYFENNEIRTGKRMNKQISEISPKMTLPMFMIANYFVVVAINVIHDTLLVQNVDIGSSLHWLTDYLVSRNVNTAMVFGYNFMTFVLR